QPAVAEEPPAAPAAPPASSAEKLAMVDPMMRKLLDDRAQKQVELEQAQTVLGPNHRAVVRLHISLEQASQRVDQYLQDYLSFHSSSTMASVSRSTTQPSKAVETAIQNAPPQPVQSIPLSASMQQLHNELEDVSRRIEVLKTE